ncbi:unnamed protein product [Leptidea sinapis]|uniref:Uncharacterized protein n=1 Tax=Leptidea sinapis TaxID=189913 RepID=A0A5E4Q1N1_9NEOP|nr:unnamed protein product [Leptidea sinapis]
MHSIAIAYLGVSENNSGYDVEAVGLHAQGLQSKAIAFILSVAWALGSVRSVQCRQIKYEYKKHVKSAGGNELAGKPRRRTKDKSSHARRNRGAPPRVRDPLPPRRSLPSALRSPRTNLQQRARPRPPIVAR